MKFTETLKRRVTRDWQLAFPDLGTHKPMHLLRRVGPLLQGICLERSSGNSDYLPTTHVHDLTGRSDHLFLQLGMDLRQQSGGVDRIRLFAHGEERVAEAATRLREQALLRLSGDLMLSEVIQAIDVYVDQHDVKYPIRTYEIAIRLLAWCGQREEALNRLERYEAIMKGWPEPREWDETRDQWSAKCRQWIDQPQVLRDLAEEHARALKTERLPTARFLCE
jgi:hypothetical protein